VFRLLAGSAAGSHVTALPEADGFVEIDRPWGAFRLASAWTVSGRAHEGDRVSHGDSAVALRKQ
jgi:hypothetical protein